MDFNFFNKKADQNISNNKGKKGKKEGNFPGSIAGAILIFMLITGVYLAVSDSTQTIPEIPNSVLANSV